MQLSRLVTAARTGKSAVYTFDRGKTERYPFPQLAADVDRVRAKLSAWGVASRMRVGIYAPNSYHWLVHDLALIEIGAISVPFTDDFAGMVNDALLEKYHIALLLISKSHARLFPQRPVHVAFMDAQNGDVAALDRMPPPEGDAADQHSLVFSSGSAGGLK